MTAKVISFVAQMSEFVSRATSEDSDSVGHWSAILVLVLFFVSSKMFTTVTELLCHVSLCTDFAVLFPLHLPIPHRITLLLCEMLVKAHIISPPSRPLRTRHIRLNFITVPLASVLILLASGAIDGSVIRRGIIGADGVKPINIMALFISLVRIFKCKFYVLGLIIYHFHTRVGIHIHLSRLYRATKVLSLLGCSKRRLVWEIALSLSLRVLPYLRRYSR